MHLGTLESAQEAAPRATVTLLSCSANFLRISITRYTHAKHEPILKYYHTAEQSKTPNCNEGKLEPQGVHVYFSSSLIIHQVKTKEITTVKEVWIPGLN